ncbi:MAG TPA: hypothetical protein VK966_07865, partial [Longimicrobiales bacterium]|nr:hypothetical protein [Longimicrobiales bacterium]
AGQLQSLRGVVRFPYTQPDPVSKKPEGARLNRELEKNCHIVRPQVFLFTHLRSVFAVHEQWT